MAANVNVEEAVFSRVVAAEAARDPDRLVLLFENGRLPAERVTAADLAVRGNRLAWALHRAGLRAGDRVAIVTHNHPEVVYGLVAGAKLGNPAVLLDPRWGSERLDLLLRLADCSAVLTADYLLADPAFAEVVRRSGAAAFALSTPEGRAGGLDPSPEWEVLNEVLDGPERGDVGEHVTDTIAPWLVAFAGGNAVEVAHGRLAFSRLVPGLLGYRADDVPYTGLSLSCGNTLAVTMLPAVWGAVRHSVFSRTLSVARIWEVCTDYGCTTWSNVGGMAAAVYREPSNGRDRAHPVRLVVSAGMHREIWRPFQERFGVKVMECEMELFDPDGRPVGPGRIGELAVRPVAGGARVRSFQDPEASARTLGRGWVRTGDMVTREEAGWLSFAFRPDHDGLRRLDDPADELVLEQAAEAPHR